MRSVLFVVSICILQLLALPSCDKKRVYDTVVDLDSSYWNEQDTLQYSFEINDTSKAYQLFYNVRYNNAYPFYNLYVTRIVEDSIGNFISKKLQAMDLFNSTTGIPFGSGIGATKDYLILAEEGYKFPYMGMYTIKLQQYMRQEKLLGLKAVGVRVDVMNP